jgi:four helix bundle protein
MIKSFKDLDVYTESYKLVLEIYELVNNFPKFEKYEFSSQLRRAAVSVPANIAEGWGKRRFLKEFQHYLDISLGSCNEMEVHLSIAKDLKYAPIKRCNELMTRYGILAEKISVLQSRWKSY